MPTFKEVYSCKFCMHFLSNHTSCMSSPSYFPCFHSPDNRLPLPLGSNKTFGHFKLTALLTFDALSLRHCLNRILLVSYETAGWVMVSSGPSIQVLTFGPLEGFYETWYKHRISRHRQLCTFNFLGVVIDLGKIYIFYLRNFL